MHVTIATCISDIIPLVWYKTLYFDPVITLVSVHNVIIIKSLNEKFNYVCVLTLWPPFINSTLSRIACNYT